MKLRTIPSTDIKVTELCLGTMMYGDQMDETAAIEQLDRATKRYGINFIDTAESFPCPHAEVVETK
jgi:aryl-alcohol dehydrogenase-like predicted oxidoreductase